MASLLDVNTVRRSVKQSIPVQLKYQPGEHFDVVTDKSMMRVTPLSGDLNYGSGAAGTLAQSKIMRFRLRSNDWIDPKSISLNFHGVVAGTSGINYTNIKPPSSCHSFFKNIKVYVNSQLVEQINNYDKLVPALAMSTLNQTYLDTQGSYQGWNIPNGGKNERFFGQLKAGFDFSIPIHSGLFGMDTWLPPGLAIDVELELNEMMDCFAIDASAGAAVGYYYSLSNCRMYFDQMKVHEAYMSRYEQELMGSGVPLEFGTYSLNVNNLPSGVSPQIAQISRGVSRARALYWVMQEATLGPTFEYKDANFTYNDVTKYRLSINGRYFPSQEGAEGVSEIFNQLERSVDQFRDFGGESCLTLERYVGDNFKPPTANPTSVFVQGQDLQLIEGARSSGLDTGALGGILQLELTGTWAAASRLYSWLFYDKGILVTSTGIAVSE